MNTIDATSRDIRKTAAHVVEGVEDLAGEGKEGFLDTMAKIGKIVATFRGLGAADMLRFVGLQRRSSASTVAAFASGLAVGAGAGLLLAPMSGIQMRARIRGAFKSFRTPAGAIERQATEVKTAVEAAAHTAADVAREVGNGVADKVAKVTRANGS